MRDQSLYWHDYRGGNTLSGYCAIPGHTKDISILHSIPLGGGFQEIHPTTDGSGDLLLASGGGIQRVSINGEYRWKSKPFGAHWITTMIDLDQDGRWEIVTSNGRDVVVLDAGNGSILWKENVATPRSYGTYATMLHVCKLLPGSKGLQIVVPCFSSKEVLIFDCGSNAAQTKLHTTLWMNDAYHPTVTIGDVNSDGQEEVVVAKLGGVYVFDPISGKQLTTTLWESDTERRRNYGQFHLKDIDNDGELEAVILSNRVSKHIAVLDNDGKGNFSPLWDRFIEHIYPTDTTELRFCHHSLIDIDCDNKEEIILSLYNAKGDGKWYTEILNSFNGETITEIPEQYLWDVQQEDGNSYLLTSVETNRIPSLLSTISIAQYFPDSSNLEIIWQCEQARFSKQSIPESSKELSYFKPEIYDAYGVWKEQSSILAFQEKDTTTLLHFDLNTRSIRTTEINLAENIDVAQIIGDNTLLLTSQGGTIVKYKDDKITSLVTAGYHLTTEAHLSARPGSIPTVARIIDSVYIAIPTFSGTVKVLCLENNSVSSAWEVKGRGRIGNDFIYHAIPILSFGGGQFFSIVDDQDLGHARLSLYDHQGKPVHQYSFPDLPSSVPGIRIGIYDWLPFDHSRGPALFISCFQSASMNSECSLAILLETGEILWRKNTIGEGEYGRGVGGWHASSFDPETHHLYFCAKDTFCVLDSETGNLLHTSLLTSYTTQEMKRLGIYKEQGFDTWSSKEDPFTAYGAVIPISYEGERYLLIAGCYGGMGLLDNKYSALWWKVTSFGDTLNRLPAIGDIDGDGALEIGQSHSDGSIAIYDWRSGEQKYEFKLGAITTDIQSCDINSDGKTEFIFGTNDGRLICMGVNNGEPVIKQEITFDAAVGSPVLSDVNRDSHPEILCSVADGRLIVLG